MAAEMEHRAKGEQFRILDPASYPQKPSKPDLLQLNMMGLLGGLAVGAALGFLQEFRDTSIHGDKDVTYYVGSTLLAACRSSSPRKHCGPRSARPVAHGL